MDDVMQFIGRYWLQFLLGAIATGLGIVAKHIWSLLKKERKEKRLAEFTDLKKELFSKMTVCSEANAKADEEIKQSISDLGNTVTNIQTGLLSVQGKQFQLDCIHLRDGVTIISDEEFRKISDDYAAYKALKGNHFGDIVYKQVSDKYEAQQKKKLEEQINQ